ncbi:MAG: hypothetical protein JWP12_1607 [Bacteroidetes bacterium]|nr:hypothetical protein [Bacteroidota bacterium]
MNTLIKIRKVVRDTLRENYFSPAKDNWEIHDDNGCISKGDYNKIIHQWNINFLADWAYKNIYGNTDRNPKLIIKEWSGQLRLICVVDENSSATGKHYNTSLLNGEPQIPLSL